MGTTLSYLTSLYGTGSDNMLAMLYGFSGQAGSSSSQNPVTAVASAEQYQAKDIKLANKLTRTRWNLVVQTYEFANEGLGAIQGPRVLSTIASAYAEVTWHHSLDAATPGLSKPLTFRGEVNQIPGDPVMRNVVTTALGIPLVGAPLRPAALRTSDTK
jgi:hypothetical protein